MPIPKLYSILPTTDIDTPDLKSLTNFSSGLIDGDNDEKYAVLSYFPEELKLSKVNSLVVNKFILFVLDQDLTIEYDAGWDIQISDGISDITNQFIVERIPGAHNFEFTVALQHTSVPDDSDWELTLTTECKVLKNGIEERTIELVQKLLPIEEDLLSKNGATFEDESGVNNSSVHVGNEQVTHFMRGHLSEYLVDKKNNEIAAAGNELNNPGAFVNQTTAIAYNNLLKTISSYSRAVNISDGNEDSFASINLNFDNPFNHFFSNFKIEQAIINESEFDKKEFKEIGIFDLNLHHVLPIVLDNLTPRVGDLETLVGSIETVYNTNKDTFIEAYHRSTFPKSAIELSVRIFDQLRASFKADSNDANLIYETFETLPEEQKAKVSEWNELEYSELRDPGNDGFMKNLITEYYLGHYNVFDRLMISQVNPNKVLKIDWSQFIQKILNPTSITVPFTLIKIQVNDLRSGKPIKNALIKRLEFFSFDEEFEEEMLNPFTAEIKYRYKITKPFGSGIPFEASDSKVKRVLKICKAMGYHSGAINNTYNQATRNAMYAYLVNDDRALPIPFDLPESASEAHMKVKKNAWIDFIIEDFEANCITDAGGILNCKIPDQLLKDRKLTINIGFTEFAVVREIFLGEDLSTMSNKPLKRPETEDGSLTTKFVAEWDGDTGFLLNPNEQNVDWDDNIEGKTFGWKISNEEGNSDYLKVAIPLVLKKSKEMDFNRLKIPIGQYFDYGYPIEDINHLSTFYEDSEIHFVLYGMQWCQPVWNPIPATATHMIKGKISPVDGTSPSINELILDVDRNFPKIVSTPLGGGTGKGRDYGAFVPRQNVTVDENGNRAPAFNASDPAAVVLESYTNNQRRPPRTRWNSALQVTENRPHYGLDYHAIEGVTPAFLPHGAIVESIRGDQTTISNSDGYGIQRLFKFGDYAIRLAHLNGDRSRDAANPDENLRKIAEGDALLCGTWIGFAGRTFREFHAAVGERYYSGGATHVHLEIGRGDMNSYLINPKTIFNNFEDEKENDIVIMNNDNHKLFPCDCHWPVLDTNQNQNANNAARCAIRDNLGIVAANRLTSKSTECWASRNLHCPYMEPNNINGITPARTAELEIFRLQAQLTYLFEDDNNQGIPRADRYADPGGIDGAWGGGTQNAIEQFRVLNEDAIFPQPDPNDPPPAVPPPVAPPAGDPWWTSQPVNGDSTWNALNTEAPYPRPINNINRVDK